MWLHTLCKPHKNGIADTQTPKKKKKKNTCGSRVTKMKRLWDVATVDMVSSDGLASPHQQGMKAEYDSKAIFVLLFSREGPAG